MKAILILSAFLSFSAFAADEHQPSPVSGHWILVDRICSSGVAPWDNFDLDRDSATLTYAHGKFSGHTQLGGCHYWTQSNYEINGSMVHYFNVASGSNCGQFNQPRRFSVHFNLNEEKTQLSLFSGPFGYGGSCPAGDMMEVIYQKH